MKKYETVEQAKVAVEQLIYSWSEFITITNVRYTKAVHGFFVDMTANRVSYRFLQELKRIMCDDNPAIEPIDEETIQIGSYFLTNNINDSGD